MMLESFFLAPFGLWTAIALLPFLLIYLIRPKPKHERIPSLLFVLKDLGKSNTRSFFRNILRDILLLLQLLILLVLILAAAKPFIEVPRTLLVDQTILVVDTSASMHGYFDEVRDKALESLGRENTLIALKANPEVLEEGVSAGQAEERIRELEPTDTGTDITSALQLANSYATSGSRVILVSDFIATKGERDFDTAADALEALGTIVEYQRVGEARENVGIIDLRVGPATSSVWVKNFNEGPEEVTLTIAGNAQQVLLAKEETKQVDFDTPVGLAELRISDDPFAPDNVAYVSTPDKTTVKLLVITNDRQSWEESYIATGLRVISRNLPTTYDIHFAEPPTIPTLDHDIYVIWKANVDFILPGYVTKLREQVEGGSSLLLFSQPALFGLDWQGLLPVEARNGSGGRSTLLPDSMAQLTRDIEFGQASEYLRVEAKEGSTTIARTEQDPVIVLGQRGRGSVLYYGLEEGQTSFSQNPTYPVFWRRTLDLLTNRPSLANLNLRTGNVVALPRTVDVEAPNEELTTNLLRLEHAGFYHLPDRTLAASLLDEREGRLEPPENLTRADAAAGEESEERVPRELTHWFLYAAMALLLLEMLYIKVRGDV